MGSKGNHLSDKRLVNASVRVNFPVRNLPEVVVMITESSSVDHFILLLIMFLAQRLPKDMVGRLT